MHFWRMMMENGNDGDVIAWEMILIFSGVSMAINHCKFGYFVSAQWFWELINFIRWIFLAEKYSEWKSMEFILNL